MGREVAARASARAKNFKVKAEREGETVTLIRLRQAGIDGENHPIYEEALTEVKGFHSKQAPSERELGAGTFPEQEATFQLPYDADVDETDFEVLSGEVRWKVVGIIVYPDYLEVKTERKA